MKELKKILNTGVNFTPAVVCYLQNEDRVLLGLRKKVSLGLGKNLVAGIGGKVGDHPETQNETAEEALIRECREEIGVEITRFRQMGQVKFIFPHKPKWNQSVKIYIVSEWIGTPKETKTTKPLWYKTNELPKTQMWPDNLYWVPKVLFGRKINMTFLYGKGGKIKECLSSKI